MFDVESAPLPDLEVELCSWAGRLSAATSHWLKLLAAFDRRNGWSKAGVPTCAHWLAWRCGLGLRASYEYLRVARAVENLPRISEIFARGEISYSKVRAITRVAKTENEEHWLARASRCTASQLESLVSSHIQLNKNPDDDENPQQKARCSWRWNEDGTFSLSARLDAERGAVVQNALIMALASLGSPDGQKSLNVDSPDGANGDGKGEDTSPIDPGSRPDRVDAIAAMAEGFISAGAPTLTNPATHTVNVHVDIETLTGVPQEKGEHPQAGVAPSYEPRNQRCDVNAGVTLPPHVAQRLSCDSLLRTLVTDGKNNPLTLGRTHRSPSTRLRRAIFARDGGRCQYPGCRNTRWLQIHHLLEWHADDGTTDAENLALVCSLHHRMVHREGIALRRGSDGSLYARHRNGTVSCQAPDLSPGADPLLHIERLSEARRRTDEPRQAA